MTRDDLDWPNGDQEDGSSQILHSSGEGLLFAFPAKVGLTGIGFGWMVSGAIQAMHQ